MVSFNRGRLYSVLLLGLLWVMCAARWAGMFDGEASLAVLGPIFRGTTDQAVVGLMFNVDWGDEHLVKILDILKEKSVKATFFPTGDWAVHSPELAKRIADEGHELGNHGKDHAHPNEMDKKEFEQHLKQGESMIEEASGKKPSRLYAPPYGEWSDTTVAWAVEAGYQTILWTADTIDWQRPPWEVIWKRAMTGACHGALILLHPTEPTVEALPAIIDGFRDKGFEPAIVSEVVTFYPGLAP